MLVENIKIITVSDVRKGKSKTTGRPWANRNVLLSFEDEFGEGYINAVVEDDVWNQLGFHEGQTVSLNLRFRTNRFSSGFIANDIRIIDPLNQQQP